MDDLKERRFLLASRSRTFRNIIKEFSLNEKKVLDLGCSYGEYTTHFGKGSIGISSNPKEVDIGVRRGLDIRFGGVENLVDMDLPRDFECIWANNIFEHLLSPHSFLMTLKKLANPKCLLILGVPVIPFPFLLTIFRKFRGIFSPAHVNFFNWRTLKFTVEYAGWDVSQVRPFITSIRVLDKCVMPMIPHIYIIARNNTSFVYSRDKLQEWEHLPHYQYLLEITNQS